MYYFVEQLAANIVQQKKGVILEEVSYKLWLSGVTN